MADQKGGSFNTEFNRGDGSIVSQVYVGAVIRALLDLMIKDMGVSELGALEKFYQIAGIVGSGARD